MSERDQWKSELADIQARLMTLAPSPSRIERDQLMYQAGFAAGRASRSQRAWIPPLLSATAATVIALIATRQYEPSVAPQPSVSSAARDAVVPSAVGTGRDKSTSDPSFSVFTSFQLDLSKAPLLAERERALRFEFDEPAAEAAHNVTVEDRATASIQQLRQEFMLQRQPSTTFGIESIWRWLQPGTDKGETT